MRVQSVTGLMVMAIAVLLLLTPALFAADIDRDGIDDTIDNCPYYYNPQQFDFDEDGIGDVCDSCSDLDGDGFGHSAYPLIDCLPDNCPCVFNPDQADSNLDGFGDACDDWMCGDINDDGLPWVDAHDFEATCRYFAGLETAPCVLAALDVDSCQGLDVLDQVFFALWAIPGTNPGDIDCDGMACTTVVGDGCSVTVSPIEGLTAADTALVGDTLTFHVRYSTDERVMGMFNTFRIYGDEGVSWSWVEFSESTALAPYFPVLHMPFGKGLSGQGADTVVLFAGIFFTNYGLQAGFDDEVLSITVGPVEIGQSVEQLCLDSCSFEPHGAWMWATGEEDWNFSQRSIPSWSGPHCVTIIHSPDDFDGDGILNEDDNCPETNNPLQRDSDGDEIADMCEEIIPTPESMFIYCDGPSVEGIPLQPGDIFLALDPDGIVCGRGIVGFDSTLGMMAIYGDDASSPETDEGAEAGDTITLLVNEIAVELSSPLIWQDMAQVETCVMSCCLLRADVDHNGTGPDIGDVVYLVSYMFQEGPPPPCHSGEQDYPETDIDGNSEGPNIADLVYLVLYMFQQGPAPVPCPE